MKSISSHVSDFYVTGGTVPRNAACYVSRKADAELLEGLRAGQFCYVLTSRQMGKSSLMVRTAMRLREEGVSCVILDLTAIGQNLDAERWYGGLLNQLGQQVGLEDELDDFWLAPSSLGPMQRWMQALHQVVLKFRAGSLVIFVDEIDAVRSLPFSADEFFAGIRHFYNRRSEDADFERLTFCLLGVATPSDLIRDTRTTPFNIGKRIELTDFTAAEATPLAEGLGVGLVAQRLLSRVLYWTGGHPYLTQRLCQAVAEQTHQPSSTSHRPQSQVDGLCEELFLSRGARERDDNLIFVRERLLRSEVDLASLLDMYGRLRQGKRVGNEESSPLVSLLRLAGIVKATDRFLEVRNRIYAHVFNRDWVRNNMPYAELWRQQQAYKRGLIRALALSGSVLAVVIGLAIYGFTQADLANRRLGESNRARKAAGVARNDALEKAQLAIARLALADIARKAERIAKNEAMTARKRADQKANLAYSRLLEANKARNAESIARKDALKQAERAHRQADEAGRQRDYANHLLYIADMNLIPAHYDQNNFGRIQELLDETRASKYRNFEWEYWNRLCHLDLRTFRGVGVPISFVVFSRDGKRFVTGGAMVKVWDTIKGKELVTLKRHAKGFLPLAFSLDGNRIFTTNRDKTASVWDATTGKELFRLNRQTDYVVSAAFSPDGKRIMTGSLDHTAKIWDATTGKELLLLKGHAGRVYWAAFSPDGRHIVTGSEDDTAKVWDSITGEELRTINGPAVSSDAAFSPDGTHTVTRGATVQVWDTITGRELVTLKGHSGYVFSAAFSPDGKRIATGGWDNTVKLWDSTTGKELLTLKGHANPIYAVAIAPDGKRILTGCLDGTAKLWDANPAQETAILTGHRGGVNAAAFSPDGTRIVTGSWDGTAKVWNAFTGKELLALKYTKEGVNSVAFSPDGKRIVTGSGDKTARVWNAITGQELFTLTGHRGSVSAAVFSRDGTRIVTGSADATAKVWNAFTGKELITLRGHSDYIHAVAFSPDGKCIVTGSSDSTAKVWDATTGRKLHTLNRHTQSVNAVAFSPDGKRIATGSSDKTAKVWDTITGKELLTLNGHSDYIYSVGFAPDGMRIVTGSADKTAKLWDATIGREILTLKGHTNDVHSTSFSSDGKRIVTGSYDNTARVWYAAMSRKTIDPQ